MLCEKCGKNTATTHIRTVVNGVVTEKNLCDSCAAKEGYQDFAKNSFAGMLSSMLGDFLGTGLPETTLRCPTCGASFEDIANSGKVGCADCYKTFYNELLPYLKRVHGNVNHTGKIPNSAPLAVKEENNSLDSLKLELSRLISEEKYEQAAVIRDKIKEIEAKNNE